MPCNAPGCSKAGDELCGGCKQARYCSRECQVKHWKHHKAECKRIQAERERMQIMAKGKAGAGCERAALALEPAAKQVAKRDDSEVKDAQAKEPEPDAITLKVGGKLFKTTRSVLCAQPDTLLASMFSGRWEEAVKRDVDGAVVLDLEPDLFAILLNKLKHKLDPSSPPTFPPPGPEFTEQQWGEWDAFLAYTGFPQQSRFASPVEGSGGRASVSANHLAAKFSHKTRPADIAVTEPPFLPCDGNTHTCTFTLGNDRRVYYDLAEFHTYWMCSVETDTAIQNGELCGKFQVCEYVRRCGTITLEVCGGEVTAVRDGERERVGTIASNEPCRFVVRAVRRSVYICG